MGYYTHYTLVTDDGRDDDHKDGIAKLVGYFNRDRWPDEACTWYQHQDDLLAYSKLHPTVLFVLDGNGEEAGDVWRKWFRNGEVREWRANVTRPTNPANPLPPAIGAEPTP